MQYKVGVIGRFGFGKVLLNGQTIKTKIIVKALAEEVGKDHILLQDTYGGIRTMLRLPFKCFCAAYRCDNLVILPARKGIRVLAPLLVFLNLAFRRKLHYVVIGGWLNNLLEKRKSLAWCLKRFEWIYVETSAMKRKLEEKGFRNVVIMPNCKDLLRLEETDLHSGDEQTCRLCTFSRVMKEKGIDIAVEAVRVANEQLGRTAYQLDVYGQVDNLQIQWFKELTESFPEGVRYCGEIPFDQSVSVLREYHALLFPTKFYTEGIPGTIIDAYAAGVPVIASRWENYSDIVDDETGIGYSFEDPDGLKNVLLQLAGDTALLNEKKVACLHRYHDFKPETVIATLVSRLELAK